MSKEYFEAHSIKQENAIFSDAKITALITGIQYGKTTAGSYWIKRKLCEFTEVDDNFLITAPTYKIMQQSTLPAFLKIMDGFGEYSKGEAEFRIRGGGTVFMRTETDPDSIVGITNIRGIWGDEAGKYSLYFWENMQARASFKDAPILLTSSPYATNWLFKEIIQPVKQGKRKDVNLIQAASNENPYFPKTEFERRKMTMDPRRFAALYLGEFQKMHGLVYDCFDEETNIVAPFQLPSGTKFYGGIDWGYTDPFALVIRAVTPQGMHFQVAEFSKTKMILNDILLIVRQMKQIWDVECFYADPSRPDYIEALNREKLTTAPANNDIRIGIDTHYELIRSNKFKLFSGQPHTLDEYQTYHYPEPDEVDSDKDTKEQDPVDSNNHLLDATRYVSISITDRTRKRTPKVAEDIPQRPKDHADELKWLMKGGTSRRFKGSEEFG